MFRVTKVIPTFGKLVDWKCNFQKYFSCASIVILVTGSITKTLGDILSRNGLYVLRKELRKEFSDTVFSNLKECSMVPDGSKYILLSVYLLC